MVKSSFRKEVLDIENSDYDFTYDYRTFSEHIYHIFTFSCSDECYEF